MPQEEVDRDVPFDGMTHEPLGFLIGTFNGSQQWRATVDQEGFAMVNTFKRLQYLLWHGAHICTDRRNLAHIFDSEACASSVAKTTAQRLGQSVGFYKEDNTWEDLAKTWDAAPQLMKSELHKLGFVTGSRINCNVTTVEGHPSSTGLNSS